MARRKNEQTDEMNYYRWKTSRWFASTTRALLDATGRGIYRELLDLCYGTGSCPADPIVQARLCGCTVKQIREIWPVIKRHFEVHPDDPEKLINRPASEARSGYYQTIESKSNAGRISAENRRNTVAENANTCSTDVQQVLEEEEVEGEEKGEGEGEVRPYPQSSPPPVLADLLRPKLVDGDTFDVSKGLEEILDAYPGQRGIDAGGQIYIGDIGRKKTAADKRKLHAAIIAGIEEHKLSADWRDRDTGELDVEFVPALDVFLGGRPKRGASIPSRMYLDHPPAWKPKAAKSGNSFMDALRSA